MFFIFVCIIKVIIIIIIIIVVVRFFYRIEIDNELSGEVYDYVKRGDFRWNMYYG